MIEAIGSGNNGGAGCSDGEQIRDLTEAIGYVSDEIAAALALSGLVERVDGKLQTIKETKAVAADLSLTDEEYRTFVGHVMDGSAVPDSGQEVFSSLLVKISERADELLSSSQPGVDLSSLERAVLKNRYVGGNVISRRQLAGSWNELFGDNLDESEILRAEIGFLRKLSASQGADINSQTTPTRLSTQASMSGLTPEDTKSTPPKPTLEDGVMLADSSDNEQINEFSQRQLLAAKILEIDPVDIEHVDETALNEFLSKLYEHYQISATQRRHKAARIRQTELLSSVYSGDTQDMEELAKTFGYTSTNSAQTTIYNTIKQLQGLAAQNPDIAEQFFAENQGSKLAEEVTQGALESDKEEEGSQVDTEEVTQQEIIRQAIIEAVNKINAAKDFDAEIAEEIRLMFANGLTTDQNNDELMAALETLNEPIQLLFRGVRVNGRKLSLANDQRLFIKARCGMLDRVGGSYKKIAEFLNKKNGKTYSIDELRELEAASLGLIAEVVSEFSTNSVKKKTSLA